VVEPAGGTITTVLPVTAFGPSVGTFAACLAVAVDRSDVILAVNAVNAAESLDPPDPEVLPLELSPQATSVARQVPAAKPTARRRSRRLVAVMDVPPGQGQDR
jgi:hypothetical protein